MMTSCWNRLPALFFFLPLAGYAQLTFIPAPAPLAFFGGKSATIPVTFKNPGEAPSEADVRIQLYQASSATAAPLRQIPWKKLQVLPSQTILESADLDFPAVKAETDFIAEWLVSSNHVIGNTVVRIYPTNLFEELKPLVGETAEKLGVLDPRNQIKPALQQSGIKFVNLENAELDAFSGRLAIAGSCVPDDPEWIDLTGRIRNLAHRGTPVVWIQGQPSGPGKLLPSFYTVPIGPDAVVVVQPELAADLSENPQSQLNLIYFCKIALNPKPLPLPELSLEH